MPRGVKRDSPTDLRIRIRQALTNIEEIKANIAYEERCIAAERSLITELERQLAEATATQGGAAAENH